MSEQPKALQLADWLESEDMPTEEASCAEAAAELRRLHALCEKMGKALERSDKELGSFAGYHRDGPTRSANAAALAKWKESE